MASDAELIGRSLSGDAEAFMEVIRRHEVAIGAYLERRVGREAAEDLLGDVWAAAFQYRGTYDRSFDGARPWLYTMALNRLRQYWRSRSSEDLVPDMTGLEDGWDPWPAVDVRVDTRTAFRAAVAGLKSDEREVLTLVAVEDLSVADAARSDVNRSDVLIVPGGFATRALEEDTALLAWIRAIDATTTWTTSVCTGAMLLAAAGLLEDKEATTHWASLDRLADYGAIASRERVVVQGKIVTAAGVSSGIDMALTLAARIAGDEYAQGIQLGIEYDPQPPFDAGAVHKAPENVVEMMTHLYAGRGVSR